MRKKIPSIVVSALLLTVAIIMVVRTTASPKGEILVDFTETGTAVKAKVYRKSSFWSSGSLTDEEVKSAGTLAQSKYPKKTRIEESETEKSGLLLIGVRPRSVEVTLQKE